jgi:hypothetical protein
MASVAIFSFLRWELLYLRSVDIVMATSESIPSWRQIAKVTLRTIQLVLMKIFDEIRSSEKQPLEPAAALLSFTSISDVVFQTFVWRAAFDANVERGTQAERIDFTAPVMPIIPLALNLLKTRSKQRDYR